MPGTKISSRSPKNKFFSFSWNNFYFAGNRLHERCILWIFAYISKHFLLEATHLQYCLQFSEKALLLKGSKCTSETQGNK